MPYSASIDVVVSDIAELEVDAIVNPTNTKLLPRSGLSTQILKKGVLKSKFNVMQLLIKFQNYL